MKKIYFILLIIALGISGIFSIAEAQQGEYESEFISSFNAEIKVNLDNSVYVRETIVYNTGSTERHGIYRDIRHYSSQGRKMVIDNVTVTDENDNPYQFQVYSVGENTSIKIGDPNQTFSGQKIYSIRYIAYDAVAQFKDFDEIYWNVTGNYWEMPIHQAQASIILPFGTQTIQSACYYGRIGSTSKCEGVGGSGNLYVFNAPSTLNPHEGLTVAVGFPKEVVVPYTATDNFLAF